MPFVYVKLNGAWDNIYTGARWDLILEWTGENVLMTLTSHYARSAASNWMSLTAGVCATDYWQAALPRCIIIYIILTSWRWTLEQTAIEVNVQSTLHCTGLYSTEGKKRLASADLHSFSLYTDRSVSQTDDHQNVTVYTCDRQCTFVR